VAQILFFCTSTLQEKEHLRSMAIALQRRTQLNTPTSVLANVEAERQRIALDLHDSIGGMLSTVLMLFDSVEAQNVERFQKVKAMLQETHREVRRIAHNITPACLEKLGLMPALTQYCDEINAAKQLLVYPVFSEEKAFKALEHSLQVNVFRIVQELIQNTIKHAEASQLDLILCVGDGKIHIIAQDNGKGSDALNSPKALRSLKQRIKMLDGKIRVRSSQTDGTEIKISLPC
jgi:two-component system, NarL family, sensor kinase